MTTIAYDGKTIASDGRLTEGDTIIGEDYIKLKRLDDGAVIGIAGNPVFFNAFVRWQNGEPDGVDPVKFKATSFIVAAKDGAVVYDNSTANHIAIKPPYALGSGSHYAIAAMKAGASATKAVQIAAELDVWTGGVITTMRLDKKR